eukprot:2669748-Prymnesium_polylepis.1
MRTLAERVAMFKRELGLDGTDQGGGSNRRRPHSWGRPETKGRNRSLTSPTTGHANTLIIPYREWVGCEHAPVACAPSREPESTGVGRKVPSAQGSGTKT